MDEAVRVQLAGKKITPSEVVVVGSFERGSPLTTGLPRRLVEAAVRAVERPGFTAAFGQMAMTRSSEPGRPFVAVFGLGSRGALDRFRFGTWLRRAASRLTGDGFRQALFKPPEHPALEGRAGALFVLRTLALAPYRFGKFRSRRRSEGRLRVVRVMPPAGAEEDYRWARPMAREIASGIALARSLANTPPNEADPEWMARQATELAASYDMEAEVLGPEDLAERGMGGILAVASGSANPPRLVRLAWGDGDETVAFVGKGVTFDSGGLSLKPPSAMDEMKFDKAGACTVLGVARALAGAGVPGRFRCYLPFAENMPDGASYRPGDIIRCGNGKTVEILNTDAEGRLLLADALAWADEEKPDALIDLATLTGACAVALGRTGAGLFTPADRLANELLTAAEEAGERIWRLPLWPSFERQMEGRHADLKNVAGRWGGASTAAAFLAQFVERRDRWAHLDIAGPAYVAKGGKGRFGATGYGVASIAAWALRRASLV